MPNKLVIVESPGKIKKIGSYLGPDYVVKASFGHVRDLDPKTMSVDIDNNFKPIYTVSKDKTKVVSELKKLSQNLEVYLAADQDREGEAIADSVRALLKLKNPKRIVFHEITKSALQKAVSNPGLINQNMVEAQKARRVLDRLVGFKISPLLWKHLPGTKSAGRVQSVLVRILVDKEKKIEESVSEKRVKINGNFKLKRKDINSTLYNINDEINYFDEIESAEKLLKKLKSDTEFKITEIESSKSNRKPFPPFITSTLQQDASTRLRMPSKLTMSIAQKLYDGGYITYMRTDSTVLSNDALGACKKYINEKYGEKYYQFRQFKSKSKNAQEAHEAIRPTKIDMENLPKEMGTNERRLYQLIRNRTLASQMADAIMDNQKIKIQPVLKSKTWKKFYFLTNLSKVKFDGFLILYGDHTDDDEDEKVDDKFLKTKEGDLVDMNKIIASEDFPNPPSRMNEPSLIRYLEKKGIGRPSTYAAIISKVLERDYVEIKNIEGVKKEIRLITLNDKFKIKNSSKKILFGAEKKKMVPTASGTRMIEFLVEHFGNILEENFTAHLETQLDKISNGKLKYVSVMTDFYQNLKPILEKLDSLKPDKKEFNDDSVLLGTTKSGAEIYTGVGKYGQFVKVKSGDKWKFSSVPKDMDPKNLTVKIAEELLKYPKVLGKRGRSEIKLYKGQYGFYFKVGKNNISIYDKDFDPDKITIEKAIDMIENPSIPGVIKTFKHKNKLIYLRKGEYGYYFQTDYQGKKINAKAPETAEKLDLDDVLEIIKERIENPPTYNSNFKKGKKFSSKAKKK